MGVALMKYPGLRRAPAAFRAPTRMRSAQDFQKSPPGGRPANDNSPASPSGPSGPDWTDIVELGSMLLPQTRLIRLLLRAYQAYSLWRDLHGDLGISKPNPVADGWTRIGNCGSDNIGPFKMGGWDTCSGLIELATPRGVEKFGSVWYLNYADHLIYWVTTGQPRAYVKGGSYRFVNPTVHPDAWPSGPIVRPAPFPLDWPAWGVEVPAPQVTPAGVTWPDAIPVPGEAPESIPQGRPRPLPAHLPWALVPVRKQRRLEEALGDDVARREDERLSRRLRSGDPITWDELDADPSSIPVVRTVVDTAGGRATTSRVRHELRAPRRNERERKTRAGGGTIRIISTAVGQITEGMDWVEALWKALPKRLRKQGFSSPVDKARDLWRYWRYIDPQRAVAEVVAMQIEDTLIGKSSQGWRKVAQEAPFLRTVQSGEGYRRRAAKEAEKWLWEQAGRPEDFDLADTLYDLMKGKH